MQQRANPIETSGESLHWSSFRIDASMLTAPGAGRPKSEDHCVFSAPGDPGTEAAGAGYLFAVLDGDSQKDNGGRAARETGSSISEVLEDPRRFELRPDLLMHRIQDANDRCHGFLKGRCAATALWIWEEPGQPGLQASWAHVGDTRLYHLNGNSWRQVTKDHAKGNLLDRAVGQGPGLIVDTGRLALRAGDALVLVSDGVWRTAPIGSVLRPSALPPTAEAVRRLVGQSRLNGSRGDTSAIAVAVGAFGDDPEPEH